MFPDAPGRLSWVHCLVCGFTPGLGVKPQTVGHGVVIRPIPLLRDWVNHMAPSGPATIEIGLRPAHGKVLVTWPLVVIRPIEPLGTLLQNHMAPSGPAAMP